MFFRRLNGKYQQDIILLEVAIIIATVGCFLLTLPLIFVSFMDSGLVHEVVSRKIAYCAWQDSSVHYPVNTLLVIVSCWAPAIVALGLSVKVGYPKWYIPVFIFVAFIAGTILFSPQFLAHYHFRIPSTRYFFRNILVSTVCSAMLIVSILIYRHKTKHKSPSAMLLACSYLWISVAFHCAASYFYIFDLFCCIE